jgi:hypothetical protein
MRAATFLAALLLLAAACLVSPVAVAESHGPPGGPPGGPPENGPGEGQNRTGSGDGNASRGPPSNSNASEVAHHRAQQGAGHRASGAWEQAVSEARAHPGQQSRADALASVPEHARGNMGLFELQEEAFLGRFVSFAIMQDGAGLKNVSLDGVVVLQAVHFPADENVTIRHAGNAVHFQGTDWRFHIVDAPPAPMTMRTEGDPVLLVMPEGTLWNPAPFGGIVEYDAGKQARLVGPDPRDPEVPGLLEVSSSLNFHVSAERVVLQHVANQHRGAIDEALTKRAIGAELTMLRGPGDQGGVFSDVVLFDEMDVIVHPGQGIGHVPENATAHTITVSAQGIPGKTIIVNLEDTLVDPRSLELRYYTQVGPDAVEEVPIRMAASLAQVLDPQSSGLMPRYWVVEDIDGVQLLVSIPHFSTHHIELLSFEAVLVKVSLVAGTLGALLLIALAAVGLVRRPKDEL